LEGINAEVGLREGILHFPVYTLPIIDPEESELSAHSRVLFSGRTYFGMLRYFSQIETVYIKYPIDING
jgi:hypothetical protein